MKLFQCQSCSQLLYFENTRCERCGRALGYLPELTELTALEPAGGDRWVPVADPERARHLCANAGWDACNWLLPADSDGAFCQACCLNQTIPDLNVPGHLDRWRRLEAAKRRLIYGLLRLHLPVVSIGEDTETGLGFDFLADPVVPHQGDPPVTTGHHQGLITINIAEADDAERERHRQAMGEPYRTLLGHLRHETGHRYWELLVRDTPAVAAFRVQFGDERYDYQAALAAHYRNGPRHDWQQWFVSAYASAHPWEDWAETWAHYLHLIDTLETAQAFGLRVRPAAGGDPALAVTADVDPYREPGFDVLIDTWFPLTYAVNSLNRSMGQPDFYPFLVAPAAVEKLRFIHDLVGQRGRIRKA